MNLFKKYWHGLFVLYPLFYLPWFFYLENKEVTYYHEIHCFIDDIIPFMEIFIIPYVIWFFYIAVSFVYLFFNTSQKEFIRFALCLEVGMTLAMGFCAIYPNCVTLRPAIIPDNVFGNMVRLLHSIDTSTNVFPSIHVFNSLVICVALNRNINTITIPHFKLINILLCTLICLSTIFLKQHSVLDLLGGIVLYIILYIVFYKVLIKD